MKKLLVLGLLLPLFAATQQSVILDGSKSHDTLGGTITAYKWRKVSGPNAVLVFTPNANAVSPSVSATPWIVGVYVFELEVTDNGGLKDLDSMVLSVTQLLPPPPPPNLPPVSNAGPDKTITLPASSASIGTQDAPGLAVQWVKQSGPMGGVIERPNESVTNVSGITSSGTYVYRKIVRNTGDGLTGSDDVVLVVKPKATCFWLFKLLGWCK